MNLNNFGAGKKFLNEVVAATPSRNRAATTPPISKNPHNPKSIGKSK